MLPHREMLKSADNALIDIAVEKKIRDYLLKRSDSGRYIEDNNAVVMWWRPQK